MNRALPLLILSVLASSVHSQDIPSYDGLGTTVVANLMQTGLEDRQRILRTWIPKLGPVSVVEAVMISSIVGRTSNCRYAALSRLVPSVQGLNLQNQNPLIRSLDDYVATGLQEKIMRQDQS